MAKDEEKYDENRIQYLSMIQSVIDRMSTLSSVVKGFAATIIVGLSAISFTDISIIVLILAMIPVFSFAILDIYYLSLEKQYRLLYEEVRSFNHKVDFKLKLDDIKSKSKKEKIRKCDCVKSFGIWGFYLPIITIAITVIILKINSIV